MFAFINCFLFIILILCHINSFIYKLNQSLLFYLYTLYAVLMIYQSKLNTT